MASERLADVRKLQDYCLNSQHQHGRHKARVFASVGILESDAEELRPALFCAASSAEAQIGAANPYGHRYVIDFDFIRRKRTIRIRSAWIVRIGEDLPRLTTCYVL
jgi:hypothetical protein